MAGLGGAAFAGGLPTGGQVIGGSATISQTSATQMQITSTTARSAISWQDFSIGQGYGVNVTQPNGGTQLEQVRGSNVSQIFGSLTSNGRIVIANPNGIWFGPHAQVDVAGLTATTAHATASDIQTFVNGGSLNLSQAGNANAAVVNQGNITISNAGLAAFVAPGVRNDGVIQARLGTVQLSSGTTATLDFYGDGLVSIAVSGQTLAQAIDPSTGKPLGSAVTNTGTLNADGGTVLVTANVASNVVDDAINTSGVIQARSVSEQNGQIVLDGGANGAVQVAGSLDASGTGAGQTGGSVQVLGNQVALNAGATVDVAGDAGGGTALIGGNFHGAGPERNAQATYVDANATVDADAITSGNGGQVAVWSDQATIFNGTITARGGSQSGNGGYVETSAAQLGVGETAKVDAGAQRGVGGEWLLDPRNLAIATSGTTSGTLTSGTLAFSTGPSTDMYVTPATISTAISGGTSVDLQANNNITVSNAVSVGSGAGSLTLQAGNSINVSASITLGGTGSFNATINDSGADTTGDRSAGQASFSMSTGTAITTAGGTINITTGTWGGGGSTNIGNISLTNLTTTGGSGRPGGAITVTNAAGNTSASGALTTNGGTATAAGQTAGTVTVTASSGSVTLSAINAIGSAAGSNNNAGGAGGSVSVTGGTVRVGAVTTSGGSSSGNATGGTAGPISLTANGGTPTLTLDGNLTARGGGTSAAARTPGAGGAVTLVGTVTPTTNVTIDSRRGPTGTVATTDGAVTLGNVSGGGQTLAVSAGTAGLTFNGLTLAALNLANSTGTETLNAGTYSIGAANVFGWNGAATMPVTTNGTLTLSQGTTFSGAVTLGSATTLSGGGNAVNFVGTINGGNALTVNTSGITTFGNTVGGTTALASLGVTGATALNANVTTTGTQTYSGAVTPNASRTLTTTNSLVTLGNVSGSGTTLTISSGLGGATFNGLTLAALGLTTTGTETLNAGTYNIGAANVFGSGTIPVATNGALTLSQGTTFSGAVTLGTDTTLNGGGNAVNFVGTVNGADALTVNTSGTTTFGNTVGGTTALSSLGVAGATALNGNVTTTGTQTYSGAVTLNANRTLTTINSLVTLGNVNGAGDTLAISSGTGGVSFAGLTLAALNLAGTTGTETLNAGTYNIGAADVFGWNGSATIPVTTNGTLTLSQGTTFSGALTLGGDTTLNGGGNAIGFGGTIGNATSRALTVNTTGATTFGGAVGGGTALASLITDAGGTTVINTTAITTSGTQTYNDAITLGADATLTTTNSLITLGGNVSGSGHTLALSTGSGGASLNGATLAMLSVATSGTVSESAGVTASDLLLTGAGAFNLTGSNTVGTLAASVGAGSISFNNGANNLEIGSVGGTSGVTAGALTLTDTAAVSQSAPVNIAGTLTLNGAGATYTLADATNSVVHLAGNIGTVNFADDGGFDISGLTASNGVTLSSIDTVTQSGAITATGGTGTLTLNGVNGTYQLDNAANRVGHLSGSTGRITYSNSNGFDIAGVTLDSRFTLYSTGAVTQSGVISVPNLVLTGTGATFTLTGANSIDTVAAQTGSLSVTDASTTLTVGAIGSVTGITTTGNVTLAETAASGGLDIDTTVSAGGAITASTVNGNITVHTGVTLGASAGGDAIVLKPGTDTVAGTITGGDFVNDSGASALSTPGNWVVYTGHDNSGGTVVDGLPGYTARYNTDTTNFTPSAGINYILYRVAPTLTVTPGAVSVTYDGTTLNNPAYSQNTANYAITGFINGDTSTSAALSLSGSMAFNDATGTVVRNAGTYTLKQGSLSFANSLNYAVSFSNPTPNAYAINQRPITVTAATNSKTYDAGMTAAATPTITSGSLGSGDTANFTESYGTKNAGSNLTLTPAGTVTDGNSGNNYSVTFVNNATGAITAAPLTITAATNTKTYDGGVTAAAKPTVSGLQGSTDSVTGLAETYTDKSAGSSKTLTVSAGYVVNDDNNGNNYTVTTVNNTTGVINQRQVTLSGSRTYDGSTGAAASILAITNNVNGDNLTLSGSGELETADVGTQHFLSTGTLSLGGTAAANYSLAGITTNGSAVLISSAGIIVELTGTRVYDGTTNAPAGILTIANKVPGDNLTLSGSGTLVSRNVGLQLFASDAGLTLGGTSAPNYTLTGIDANGSAVSITARPITVTATANTKTYDATNSATATPTITSGSLGSGDSATWIEDYDGNKNAGTGLVMVPTGTISDGNSGANYDVTFVNTFNGVITAAPLTITAVTNTKTYDGGVTAAAIPTYSGTFGSDSVTGLAETYTNKNAGSGKTLTVSSGYTVNDGNDGNNYTVSTVSNTTGVINKAALTITAVANTKTYDAGITAAVTPTVSGLQGSDTASGVAETYGNKNAGTGKQLSVSAYTINDGNSGNNYTVSTAVNNSGVINAAPLTITAATDTKVYDGGVSAAATPTVSGLWGTDTVTGLAEQYNTKHARTGKTLTVTSYTVNDGNSGANYIVSLLDDTTGVITKAPLTITAVTNTKTYDATTAAAATPTVSGLQTGDSVGDLAETYDNKNAATGKTLAVSGYNISDGNGGNNYTVSTVANNTGVVSQKALTVTAQANTKTYDGGVTAATLPLITAGALQGTDTAALSETYDNKNTGSGKTLTPLVVINDGVGGANYAVTYANNTAGEIDKAPLSITADNKSKIVGTDNPTLTASYTGLVGGDTSSVVTGLSLATTATTTSPVGTFPITASGGTATNYVISYVDGVLTITVPPSQSAPSGSVVQVSRQAFDPGEPMPYAFGPTPTVNLGMGAGGAVTEGEVAGIGPVPGEGDYLESVFDFVNNFLNGTEDLPPEP